MPRLSPRPAEYRISPPRLQEPWIFFAFNCATRDTVPCRTAKIAHESDFFSFFFFERKGADFGRASQVYRFRAFRPPILDAFLFPLSYTVYHRFIVVYCHLGLLVCTHSASTALPSTPAGGSSSLSMGH